MIQRIQSVYLVMILLIIASLCSINIMHLVYVEAKTQSTEYLMNLFYFNIKADGVLVESNIQYLLISVAAMVMGLSAYILFSFKNRNKQMTFTRIAIVAVFVLMVLFFVQAYLFVPNFSSDKLLMNSIIGIALLIFCQYLIIRVYYLIKKDEDLVRSADRIR